MDDVRTVDCEGSWHSSGPLFGLLFFDFSDSRGSPGAAARRELRRSAGSDGHGGAEPRPRVGLLAPQLETAPFPNYFVVEPPMYEVVWRSLSIDGHHWPCRRPVGLSPPCSRRWRRGGSFCLRDGARASGSRSSPSWSFRSFRSRSGTAGPSSPTRRCSARPWPGWPAGIIRSSAEAACWRAAGWCLLALGFAVKITSAFLLIPLFWMIGRKGRRWEIAGGLHDAASRRCSGISGPTT